MSSPALQMLLERLLWPVPRVRWEVARSIARLIRENDVDARGALVRWLRKRQLESEAVMILGIIDAFDLGRFFDYPTVSEAVVAPSYASDFLLRRNFEGTRSAAPFGYSVSPSDPAQLPRHQETWFALYQHAAVPPIFAHRLGLLQRSTGYPFLSRWEHEWRWIQSTNPTARPDPHHFIGVGKQGQLDLAQRETYVSAYLRTLAHAALLGAITDDEAEEQALLTLTMNRGLADLETIARPSWSDIRLPLHPDQGEAVARELWNSARMASVAGETPIALHVFDYDSEGFVEVEITQTICKKGSAIPPTEAAPLGSIELAGERGMMAGSVLPTEPGRAIEIDGALCIAKMMVPEDVGCVHREMAPNVKVACPDLFRAFAEVKCGSKDIRLETQSGVFSRWVHWYSKWEPATYRDVHSTIGWMTTIANEYQERLRSYIDAETRVLVMVRQGSGRQYHAESEAEESAFWMGV